MADNDSLDNYMKLDDFVDKIYNLITEPKAMSDKNWRQLAEEMLKKKGLKMKKDGGIFLLRKTLGPFSAELIKNTKQDPNYIWRSEGQIEEKKNFIKGTLINHTEGWKRVYTPHGGRRSRTRLAAKKSGKKKRHHKKRKNKSKKM